jgi:hypothetical protein
LVDPTNLDWNNIVAAFVRLSGMHIIIFHAKVQPKGYEN